MGKTKKHMGQSPQLEVSYMGETRGKTENRFLHSGLLGHERLYVLFKQKRYTICSRNQRWIPSLTLRVVNHHSIAARWNFI